MIKCIFQETAGKQSSEVSALRPIANLLLTKIIIVQLMYKKKN